jgi:DNA-binding NarL/FixJ family response regulator
MHPNTAGVEAAPAAKIGAACSGSVLLLVDDCKLYRDGLAEILARQYGTEAIRTAHDVSSLARALGEVRADVVLLNLASFESRALIRCVRTSAPDSQLIVLGVNEDDEAEVIACAEGGVAGYHSRRGSLADLVALIASVLAGESLCPARISALLIRRVASLATGGRPDSRAVVLTQREIQIAELLELGLSNNEIAERLCIGVATVKNHVHSLLAKLGVRRRTHVAAVVRGRVTVG